MPFIVDRSALVSESAGNADLVFLHGIGEGADGGNNGLNAVRTRSPFLNQFALTNFRLIAPQLAKREERWANRLEDVAQLIANLRPGPEGRARPLFLCGFSIGGAGVVDAVNRFAGGNDIAVSAWCSVDAALPNEEPLPRISPEANRIRHLLVRGPYGFQSEGEIVLPDAHEPPLKYHAWVALKVFQEGRPLVGDRHLYQWLLA